MKFILLPLALIISSCSSVQYGPQSSAAATLLGAAAGAVIGHQSGYGASGAIAGSMAGSLAHEALAPRRPYYPVSYGPPPIDRHTASSHSSYYQNGPLCQPFH